MKEKELAEKKRLQEEEQRLKREREEAERKFKEFRLTTFLAKIEQFYSMRQRKAIRSCFSRIVKYDMHLKTIYMKVPLR